MELNSYFVGLLGSIEPNSTSVASAKTAHETLRSQLEKDDEASQANPDTYLTGSYGRATAIKDIKDVDTIMMIDLDHTKTAPDLVVAWVQSVLQKYYTQVRAQGRSVGVTTASGFDLDVVPSVAMSYREGPLWIPDRDAGAWVASHPKGQIAFGISRNQATDGYYKHLVKIMKHWRDRLMPAASQVKSYILESLIAQNVLFQPVSYGHGVQQILQGIDSSYSPYVVAKIVPIISDPGYPSVNVAKRWKFDEFSKFMQRVKHSRALAEAALAEDDQGRSIALWRQLFGTSFAPRS